MPHGRILTVLTALLCLLFINSKVQQKLALKFKNEIAELLYPKLGAWKIYGNEAIT